MAKSPFYKISIEQSNLDVTEMCTSFNYEDCLEEDDLITLKLEGADFSVIDDGTFDVGVKLIFLYGFISGIQSAKKVCQIINVSHDYVFSKVNITVKCRDLGFVSKKLSNKTVFINKTASEIASEIADKLGLKKDIQKTNTKYDNMPMAGKNYHQFLKELAYKEGSKIDSDNGTVEYYVRGDVLTFKSRDFSIDAKKKFDYGNGDGIITNIKITYEDGGNGASSSVSTSGIDTETGKEFESKATSQTNKETSTGTDRLDFDVNAVLKSKDENDTGKNVFVPAVNKTDADLQTGAAHKNAASKITKLTITTELDPTINAGDIITVSGLAQKHIGNWRVYKATHSVENSDADSVFECYRNAAKKTSTTTINKAAGNKNNSVGPNDTNTEKKLLTFDENSNLLD